MSVWRWALTFGKRGPVGVASFLPRDSSLGWLVGPSISGVFLWDPAPRVFWVPSSSPCWVSHVTPGQAVLTRGRDVTTPLRVFGCCCCLLHARLARNDVFLRGRYSEWDPPCHAQGGRGKISRSPGLPFVSKGSVPSHFALPPPSRIQVEPFWAFFLESGPSSRCLGRTLRPC